jgi:hypothetical protein
MESGVDDRIPSFYHDGYGPVASTTKGSFLSGWVTSHCLRNTQEISQFPVTYSVGWWVNKSTHGTNPCSLRHLRQHDISHKYLDTASLYSSFYLLTGGGGGPPSASWFHSSNEDGEDRHDNKQNTKKCIEWITMYIQKWEVINNRIRPSTRPLMKEIQHFIFKIGKEKHRSRGKQGTSTEDTKWATARK